MDFSDALRKLKDGSWMRRKGWNSIHQWVRLQMPDDTSLMTLPYLYIRTPTGDLVPWLASQTDLLEDDWEEVMGEEEEE